MSGFLGALSITLGVDTRELARARKELHEFGQQAKGSLAGVSRQMQDMGKAMQRTGRSMTRNLTLPLVGFGTAAFKLGKDFEREMSKIEGLVGIPRAQIQAWEHDLLKLAPALGKAPKELAEALYFITSAGIRGSAAMDVLEASARASGAGMGETKVVADLVTSAVNAYGIENINAAQAVDILTATVREGKTESTALASTMGFVLPAASQMGVSLNEVGAAMAAMTRTGTNASTAAIQLRQMLYSILKPSQQAEGALRAMGLSSSELRQQIRDKGLLSVLGRLNALQNQYGDDTMGKVFPNIRALSGILDIMGANMENNIGIFSRMDDATGDSARAWEAYKETLAFTWNQFTAQFRTSLVQFNKTLSSSVVPIIQKLTEFIAELTQKWLSLSVGMRNVIVHLLAVTAAAGPVLFILGGITIAIGKLIAGFLMLRKVFLIATAIELGLTKISVGLGIVNKLLIKQGGLWAMVKLTAVKGLAAIVRGVVGLTAAMTPLTIMIGVIKAALLAIMVIPVLLYLRREFQWAALVVESFKYAFIEFGMIVRQVFTTFIDVVRDGFNNLFAELTTGLGLFIKRFANALNKLPGFERLEASAHRVSAVLVQFGLERHKSEAQQDEEALLRRRHHLAEREQLEKDFYKDVDAIIKDFADREENHKINMNMADEFAKLQKEIEEATEGFMLAQQGLSEISPPEDMGGKAIKTDMELVADYIRELAYAKEQIGKTAAEIEVMNWAKNEGVELSKEFTQLLIDETQAVQDKKDALEELNTIERDYNNITDGLRTREQQVADSYGKQIETVKRAMELEVVATAEGNQVILELMRRRNEEIAAIQDAQLTTFYDKYKNTIDRLATYWTDGLIDMVASGEANFTKLLHGFSVMVAKMLAKTLVLKALQVGLGFPVMPATGGVTAFAKGGIVDSPTYFGMSGSSVGLMGEAGSEAIMPVTRVSGGELGVRAELPQQKTPEVTVVIVDDKDKYAEFLSSNKGKNIVTKHLRSEGVY